MGRRKNKKSADDADFLFDKNLWYNITHKQIYANNQGGGGEVCKLDEVEN